VVGITGTDGKTTTAFLAAGALEAAGLSSGLSGTVATQIGDRREANPEHTTTPGAPLLQQTLRAMVAAGNAVAVVETTSHGLAADRVLGIAQEAGARVLTYGTDPAADVRATHVEEDARRLRIVVAAPSGDGSVDLQLAGRFNVHNALAVVALGEVLELDPAAVQAGLAAVQGVPGRM